MAPNFICGQVWIMCAFSSIWTIWKCRNDVVFNDRKLGLDLLFDQTVLRVAWWCKSRWPEGRWAISDIVADPTRLSEVQNRGKIMQHSQWTAPGRGTLKFNTDAAVKGVGVSDVMTAELFAIHEALKLFVASKWSQDFEVTIESDNKSAVEWLQDPVLAHSHFRNLVHQSLALSSRVRCRFIHVPRECNSLADNLAKKGVGRDKELVIYEPL
ncbi:hypothetical protein HRI_000535700 [Hibiscus trionum]|uniref:RNase H type-1 domain-containing protein n=1 Tax=Hibiscus trionum TaxID=183268 RepID=A0A9W7H042_HIBTR|nr:hypothetical protein HRI_000535700 [Hibiscus trionum]